MFQVVATETVRAHTENALISELKLDCGDMRTCGGKLSSLSRNNLENCGCLFILESVFKKHTSWC